MTGEQEAEIRGLLQNRWPLEIRGTRDETWAEWRKSLLRYDYRDVMNAILGLSETQERFPALARLMIACQVQREERDRATRLAMATPVQRETTIAERLAEFDRGARESRIELHRELDDFQRKTLSNFGVPAITQAQLVEANERIEAIGPHEAMARSLVERGENPGVAAQAHVDAFVASLGPASGHVVTLRHGPRRDDVGAAAVAAGVEVDADTTSDFAGVRSSQDPREMEMSAVEKELIEENELL